MPKSVNIHTAKTHFSRLVERAARGEEIVIARAGRPVARLVPMRRSTKPRVPGRWRGQIVIAPDFDAVNEDILRDFDG
jgi:prevent-host-death family protein